ncbi:arginase Car3 [Schizosaccharomyces octosporus yFS286]|uniref:Arginase n=1 Tax=Schizosaccharomyces octosporus (strain yFS286) TaxID=483514 RepID=S9PXA7_SCHOY|nr:arginase Car3 [Schizosaccharomyces octosporus yFS286]EPX72602.1 arginase Car3 [Schizosaccharomyces octosporus yFS286]
MLPHRLSMLNKFIQTNQVSIINLPFSGGQPKKGTEDAPELIEKAGIQSDLENLGYSVRYIQNPSFKTPPQIEGPSKDIIKNPQYVSDVCRQVRDTVKQELSQQRLVVNVGGDHSLGMGTIEGVQSVYDDACVLWIDAHADINTPESSPSKNLHGCPLAFSLGYVDPVPPEFAWTKRVIDEKRLAFIGLRDLDPQERAFLREHNIAAFTMHHVDKYGISKVIEMALEHINPGNRHPVHLSFDVDSCDPAVAPSTGTRVPGGLTFREAMYLCEATAETSTLVAIDVMEVNPRLGNEEDSEATVNLARSIIRTSLGQTLL